MGARGGGEGDIKKVSGLERVLRAACLLVGTLFLSTGTWSLVGALPAGRQDVQSPAIERAATAARGPSIRARAVRLGEAGAAAEAGLEAAPAAAAAVEPVRAVMPAAQGGGRGGSERVAALIREAAARHGVDPNLLLRVAWCESRYDPTAYNAVLGASGLFQIIPGTWAANSARAGYAGASVFDPDANANVAAWMFRNGGAGLWACK